MPIGLSPKEEKLLKLLPKSGKKRDTNQLMEQFYRDDPEPPFHARTIIAGRMRTISAKLRAMGSPIQIKSSKRSGPKPIEFWREEA